MTTKICGQSLTFWTIFIGFVYLIQGIINSSIMIVNLIKYKEDKMKATVAGQPYDEDKEFVSALCVSLVLCVSFVLTTPFLLWGAYKEKHLFIVPWLYNSIVSIVVNCLYLLVTILKNLYKLDKTKDEVSNCIFMVFTMALGLILQVTFHRIAYNLYKELVSERGIEFLENESTIIMVHEEPAVNQR